ncbi:MAG: DUF3047 domain-containing protein [Deltaproteobacteria bacterium]|jgi:hypothetical protein|nr:DUF3047 domain-containing protein [Deltaproteobacteria bacterium]
MVMRAFGEEEEKVEGIAFVVDTDNTGENVVSYFDDFVISDKVTEGKTLHPLRDSERRAPWI